MVICEQIVEIVEKKFDEIKKALEILEGELVSFFAPDQNASQEEFQEDIITETETKIILEDGLTVGGKPIREYFEAIGHSKAYDYIYSLSNKREITEHNIKQLHKLFFSSIDEKEAGKYRKQKVFVSGSQCNVPVPDMVPARMKELVDSL